MLISAENGAGQICLFEQWVAPGAGAPLHRHETEEVLRVLAGTAEVTVEAAVLLVAEGQSVIVPAGRWHGFRNTGLGSLHVLAVLASPMFEATMQSTGETVRRWEAVAAARALADPVDTEARAG